MINKLKNFFLFSLLIHGGIFFFFILFTHLFQKTNNEPPLEVEFIASSKTDKKIVSSQDSKDLQKKTKFLNAKNRTTNKKNNFFHLKNDLSRINSSGYLLSPLENNIYNEDLYGNKGDLQNVLLRASPMEKIAKMIFDSTSYPKSFIDNQIEGQVSIKITITDTLQLIKWEKPMGTNDLLNAYVFVNILKIFENQISEASVEKLVSSFTVNLNFDFHTQTLHGKSVDKNYEIIDPSIYFRFVHFREPNVVRWINEHIPIVPIPGGVMINVIAVVDIIKNWDKMSPDAQRKRLIYLLQQQLNHKMNHLESSLPRTPVPKKAESDYGKQGITTL